MTEGVIVKGIGGFYYVRCGDALYECKARGLFRKDDIVPLPGDRVRIGIIDEDKKLGHIEEILPRQSCLIRPAVANVNQVCLVMAAKSPQPDLVLADKLVLTAMKKGLDVIICINKVDLDTEGEYKGIVRAYKLADYAVVPVSFVSNCGFDDLRPLLLGKITVFAGQSGVGKSTLLNQIMERWVMETGNVSSKIERGKHTTRHAELVELKEGGFVVDTPGFSSYTLEDIEHQELEDYYPEFRDALGQCRFTGCSHITEPQCAVKDKLEKGWIDAGRYERYTHFYTELKEASYNYKDKNKKRKTR